MAARLTTRVLSGRDAVAEAGRLLRSGGIVAIPTETVYGLAASAYDEVACRRIFAAKGRPQDNPLIVHVADMEAVRQIWREVPPQALLLMEAFWPGPLSIILPKSDRIPDTVSAGLDTVAVRMPASQTAREIIREAGVPLAAPSANRSGRPSPTSAQHVLMDMDGRIPLIVDDGPCAVGVESTVVDLTGDVPVVLRPGDIRAEDIARTIGSAEKGTKNRESGDAPRSPGMKYAHYAPKAAVCVYDGEGVPAAVRSCFVQHAAGGGSPVILCSEDAAAFYDGLAVRSLGTGPRDAEHRIFRELRDADARGNDLILVHYEESMGEAVRDRISRAAGARRGESS